MSKKRKVLTIDTESISDGTCIEDEKFSNPIFNFYGIWSDLTDEEFTSLTDAIQDVHTRVSHKYFHD